MSILTNLERENLIHNLENLLEDYDYKYTIDALDHIIEVWEENKGDLITHFKNHPNYVEGKFLIAFTSDFERGIDVKAIIRFANWVNSSFRAIVDCNYLPEDIDKIRRETHKTYLPQDMYDWLYYELGSINEQFVSETLAETLNDIFPFGHAHKGQKVSRVINKILTYLGFNKLSGYNREYAKFADALSPITIKRHTVLSINPLDYLTMSFGNSWASCHTIDKRNKRNMPNSYEGMYSSGTMSYMLDGTSMVFYTVDAAYDGTDYWTQPKINRQMYHWGEEKLVQSRLYPQDNDGDSSVGVPYRNIVQGIMSTIYDFPNLWTFKEGTSPIYNVVVSHGTHYKDYTNFGTCTLSRVKGTDNDNIMHIGHSPICIECGCEHNTENNINCCTNKHICQDCGCEIHDHNDNIYWIDGEAYCEDCVHWCDHCETYVREVHYVHSRGYARYVCESCRDEYYAECEDCGEWHRTEDMTWVESESDYYCSDCDGDLIYCDECGEYVHEDNSMYVPRERINICDDCREEYFTPCDHCSEPVRCSDAIEDEETGCTYCPECWEEMANENEEDAM